MSDSALLDVDSVTRRFAARRGKGSVVAVDDVSFRLPGDRAKIIAMAGESGSGKSTIAALLLGFLAPSQGRIRFAGVDVSSASRSERTRFRREVQAVLQDPFGAFNPFYPVEHALEIAVLSFSLASGAAKRRELIEEALRSVRLDPDATIGRHPHQLSGGQLQRIMIARALMIRPRMIVADEPVSMIDASLRAIVLDIMAGLRDHHGISQIYITHDLSSALQISDEILILYRGMVVERGDAQRVIGAPMHPYTQLLVNSVPVPNPERKWDSPLTGKLAADVGEALSESGCPFAARCPHVMSVCTRRRPPEFVVGEDQSAACFLYEGSATGVALTSNSRGDQT